MVFHTAVLSYLPPEARAEFAATMRALPARWISNESPDVLPSVAARLTRPAPRDQLTFILALDEQPVAVTAPHGEWLHWHG